MPAPTRHPIGDPLEAATEFLAPFVTPIIERINVDEFTTVEFVAAMQLDPPTRDAYQSAIADYWGHEDPEMAKMVIHGQVIPDLLRRSGLVEWAGYAHGIDDPYAVPAWWKKRR
jgi:hypothetical protein